MELALNEVKTQAKKLLKAIKTNSDTEHQRLILKKVHLSSPEELKLKHCLTIVAQQLGFDNWHHGQYILSGYKKADEHIAMGSFFYPKACGGFINEWFADYQQAELTLTEHTDTKWLLPYKQQFIVVKEDYIAMFKLDEKLLSLWTEINHNMVASYNSLAWDTLTCAIIKNRPRD